jgi:branched-chain amino acid aminotransferase
MPYINFNGKLFRSDIPVLKTSNRAFCYGDALFETMRFKKNKIFFINDHIDRLFRGMKYLKMEIPKNYSVSFFEKHISDIAKRNGIKDNARIRLQVFRNEGGYYSPTENTTGFVISAEKLADDHIKQTKGLTIDLFSEIKKLKNPLSNFKTSNGIIYVLAAIFARENNIDDCFILNTDGNITDTVSSNVFILKKNFLITPPLSDGCVQGVMRKNILKYCKKEKILIAEKSITIRDLLTAEEIYLSNSIQGIRWVKQFRNKKYSNEFLKYLNAL